MSKNLHKQHDPGQNDRSLILDETELLTWFGIAARSAQMFETALAQLTIGVFMVEHQKEMFTNLGENPFESIKKHTLGQLLARAKQVVEFDPILENQLQEAVRTRNHLFHHFFSDNKTRSELIDELRSAMNQFIQTTKALRDLTTPIINNLGMTINDLDAQVQPWRNKDIDM
ncbi:MAG: hypothetical protein MUO30_06750 [Anaerolineales bacterium]|nr:hypothetical protein [Anaerolineales bacterium]